MSASHQKKLRKETNPVEVEKKREAAAKEAKDAKKLKIWTAVFFVALAVMLIGVAVAAFVGSGVMERNMTAVTVGNHKLSAADINYYYVTAVNNETYLPYMVDTTKPLDQQEYTEDQTWADLMMNTAVQTARNTYAVYDEAVANGATLSEADAAAIDQQLQSLNTYAAMYGFADGNALLAANYGKGCNEKNYREYMTVQAIATAWANQKVESLSFDQAAIDAEAAANPDDYTSYSYRLVSLYTSKFYTNTEATEHTDEEKAAALEAAKSAAQMVVKAGEKGEDEFVSAASMALGTETDGTLRAGVLKSSITSVMADWVTASERKAGDVTTIDMADDAGVYVLMFLSSDDNSGIHLVNVRHILIQTSDTVTEDDAKEKINNIKAQFDEDPTEEKFAALAGELTEDTGSATTGGLYENVYPGQMVTPFNDWCFDETRKAGDVGVVTTDYGVHLMYYVGAAEKTYRDFMVENTLMNNAYNEWYKGLTEACTYSEGWAMKLAHTSVMVQANNSSY